MDGRRKQSGFTLVEIIIGTIVLGVAVSGMLTVFVMSRHNVGLTRNRLTALNFAQQEMERLKVSVVPTGFPGVVDPLPAGSYLVTDFNGARSFLDVTPDVVGTDLTRITVEVSWNEPDPD